MNSGLASRNASTTSEFSFLNIEQVEYTRVPPGLTPWEAAVKSCICSEANSLSDSGVVFHRPSGVLRQVPEQEQAVSTRTPSNLPLYCFGMVFLSELPLLEPC